MQSLRHWSLRAWFLHCYLIATLFLPPFPVTRAYWTDTDHSGSRVEVENPTSGDIWWGADSDGDLLTNEQEVYFGSDPYSLDSDRDGLTDYVEFGYSQAALDAGGPLPYDPWLWDTDGDGYSDFDECYQQINGYQPVVNYLSLPGGLTWPAGTFYTYSDADGDGVINPEDSDPLNMDRDGDGIYNWNEQPGCMDDASNGYTPPLPDNDPGVYIGGAWYPSGTLDSDNDGIPDQMDPFPWGSYTYNNIEYAGSWVDGDGDGIPDPADVYADDPTNGTGFYYDGVWYYNATWTDADYDGIPDPADFYPGDPTNGNGYNYNGCWYSGPWADADSDGIPDPADAFPNDSNNGASTETGYTYNGVWYVGTWIDSDGDGIPDPLDSYPSDPNNGSYYFNGNWYSGTWTDSDSDGIPDPADNYPLDPYNGTSDPSASAGYSYNGVWYYGNWLDSDGDGIPDPADGAPNDPYNGMGYSYNGNWYPGTWTDSDNDNIPDPADAYPTDPNNNFGFWYEGSWYFGSWADSDNDGIPDQADNYPYDANNGGYYYGGTWYSGSWADADNDGIPDPADGYPFDQYNGGYVYQGIWYPGPWSDYDNDDIPDAADNWSADPENGADNDYDGLTNYEERTQYGTDPDNVDTDGDGLTDFEEIHSWHTNPLLQKTDPNQVYTDYYLVDQTDTDGDGIPDRIEQWYASQGYGMSMNDPADAAGDLDADGYSNLQAYRNGWSLIADLDHYDDDGDGILDVLEDAWSAKYPGILSKTDSNDAVQDFDGDGLMNFEEIYLGIDPGRAGSFGSGITDMQYWIWCTITSLAPPSLTLSGMTTTTSPQPSWLEMADADHDGAADGLQALAAALNADPTLITVPPRATSTDYDGDGMPDLWEYQNHLDLRDPGDAQANPDGDSMLNLQEYQQGRNPNVNDDPSLQITTLSLPDAVVNAGYSTSITASGGVPPYQFSVSNGALPDGFSLDISGSLSGMSALVGSSSFAVQVTDSIGLSAVQNLMLNVRSDGTPPPGDDDGGGGEVVSSLIITTTSLPGGVVGSSYSAPLSAANGVPPYAFSLSLMAGETGLPPGYTLGAEGMLTSYGASNGQSDVGIYTFTVRVDDAAAHTDVRQLTFALHDTDWVDTTGGTGGTGGDLLQSMGEPVLVARRASAALVIPGPTYTSTVVFKPTDFNKSGTASNEADADASFDIAVNDPDIISLTTNQAPQKTSDPTWAYTVTVTQYDSDTDSTIYVDEIRTYVGTYEGAVADQMNASENISTLVMSKDAVWEWKLAGKKYETRTELTPSDSKAFYRQQNWEGIEEVTHDKDEIEKMTGDAPRSWLDTVTAPPSQPLSDEQWMALPSQTPTAGGGWSSYKENHYPSGGAAEVCLRRRDVSAAAMQKPLSRTFLRVHEEEGVITDVTTVTLTIAPGQMISHSGSGLDAEDGTVLLTGRPEDDVTSWGREWLAFLDLDVDSDNNNGGDLPDRSEVEEKAQQGSKIGKVVTVNDGDWDGDGVPDFADGLDKFHGKGVGPKEDGSLQTAPLIPIIMQFQGLGVSTGGLKIKLQYPASDPNNVRLSEYEYAPPKYDLPETGILRLWKHDSDTERKVAPVTGNASADGDFIPSDVEIDVARLGESDNNGNYTLFLESVKVSTELKDQKISLWVKGGDNGAWIKMDEVALTSYSAYTCAPSEDGSSVTRITNPVVSLPRPVVTLNQISVSNPHLDDDGATILGNLVIAGTVTSDVCDLIPESKGGVISTANVGVNGLAGAGGSISLVVSKTAQPENLRHPYPYQGTFSQTMTDVPLLQGLNNVVVGVRDPAYHLAGEVSATFEVDLVDTLADAITAAGFPVGGGSNVSIVYPGGIPAGSAVPVAANQLFVTLTRDGSSVSATLTATPSTDPPLYLDATSGLIVQVVSGGPVSDTSVDRVLVSVQTATGSLRETFVGIESAPDSQTFNGHNTYSPPIDIYSGTENAATVRVAVSAADHDEPIPEGRIDPFLIKIDGPQALFEYIQTLKQGDRELPVAEVRGEEEGDKMHFIGLPGETNAPAVSLLVPVQPFVEVSEAPPPMTSDPNGGSSWLPPPVGTDEELLDGTDAIIVQTDPLKKLLDPSGDGRLSSEDLVLRMERLGKALAPDDAGKFGSGFMDGVGANLSEQWQGLKDMPTDLWSHLGAGVDKAKATVMAVPDAAMSAAKKWWKLNRKVGLVLVFATEKVFDADLLTENMRAEAVGAINQARDTMVSAARAVDGAVGATVDAVKRAAEIADKVFTDGPAFVSLLKEGNFAEAKELGPDAYEALQMTAGLLLEMQDSLDAVSNEQKGYLCGYIFSEALVSVLGTAAATAVTAGVGAALIGPRMVRFYQAIMKSDKVRAQMTQSGCWNKMESYMDNMIRYILKGGCFAAGTLVMTAQGLSPIETITPGTWVLSADEHSGRREFRQVAQTFVTHPSALIEVSVKPESGPQAKTLPETILSTEEHPFYVLGGEPASGVDEGARLQGTWRGAAALHPGDHVWLSSGSSGTVTGVRRLAGSPNHTLTTYNFEVSEHHTYFVGRAGVWVHNACPKKIEKLVTRMIDEDPLDNDPKGVLDRMAAMNKRATKRDRLTPNEFGHAAHKIMTKLENMWLETIPEGGVGEIDDWFNVMRNLKQNSSGYQSVRSAFRNSTDRSTQGGWAVHHDWEQWLGPRTGFSWMTPDADNVPQSIMPSLVQGKDRNGQPYWAGGAYEKIHDAPIPYHNGTGLAGELAVVRNAFDTSPDKNTTAGKLRLIRQYYDTVNREPYSKHGNLAKVTRRVINATLRKHAHLTNDDAWLDGIID